METMPTTMANGGSVTKTLTNQTFFVTGCTGFVGKVMLEKLLRSVETKRVFVLVRPRKGSTALERLNKEVRDSPIFRRLISEIGYDNFIQRFADKVYPVPGELTQSKVGLTEELLALLYDTLDVIIHCAAVVDFNERIDRAIELNTLGSLRMLEIGKQCAHLSAFVHVSTAYTNSNKRGWIDEKLYPLGFEPWDMIKKVQNMSVSELTTKTDVTNMLGDWPNTYTMTKAMTEHLLVAERGNVPLAIVRPSIIGSSWQEPEPGWVDVITAAGAVYMTVGMGVLKFLPGSPHLIADIVPVDYVTNTIFASIAAVWQQDRHYVFHACSSVEKPMAWGEPLIQVLDFFQTHPPEGNIAPASFRFCRTSQEYEATFFLRYSVPASILSTVASVGTTQFKEKAALFNKLVFRVRVVIESFKHFTQNEWNFDNKHVRALKTLICDEEANTWNLDLSSINWDSYNIAFTYGLLKHVLKMKLIPLPDNYNDTVWQNLNLPVYRKESEKTLLSTLLPDISLTSETWNSRYTYPQARSPVDMKALILSRPEVQQAIQREANDPRSKLGAADVTARADAIATKMFGEVSGNVLQGMALFFRKLWRKLYKSVRVELKMLAKIRECAKEAPLIYIPTHRSYIDFLVVSYVCFVANLPMPFIAAGEDFLGILFVRWLFRKSGAFFIRRSFADDPLYQTIFQQYIIQQLQDGQSIEFFIEGTRSRSGKMLHPKTGLLSVITDAILTNKVEDAYIVPISLNYEKTIEGQMYSNELAGNSKIRESLRSLLKSSAILKSKFGQISVNFAEPISLRQYSESQISIYNSGAFLPGMAPLSFHQSQSEDVMTLDTDDLKSGDLKEQKYDPIHNRQHRQHFNRALAYRVVYDLTTHTEAMPTHLVATLLLMFRQGITKEQLVEKVDWLRQEIIKRGGQTCGFSQYEKTHLVEEAILQLQYLIRQTRQNVYEPKISSREEYSNMLVLGHYRNKIVHMFFMEGLYACALYSFGEQQSHSGVEQKELLNEVSFLYSLLRREFIYKLHPDADEDFEATLAGMVARGILHITSDEKVEVAPSGEAHFSFLCQLLWPFIDSYLVATMALFSLQPNHSMERDVLIQRTQMLATTLYHESMLCHYESCSKETLANAVHVMKDWKIVRTEKVSKRSNKRGAKPRSVTMVSLLPEYQHEGELQELVDRISKLRKLPPVSKSGLRRNMVADIPILAKL